MNLLSFIGNWLDCRSPGIDIMTKFDLVVAFDGGDDRKQSAVTMIEGGFANYILLTPLTPSEVNDKYGIDPSKVVTPLYPVTDTRQEAKMITQVCDQNNFNKVLAVSSDYHLRRCKWNLFLMNILNLFSRGFRYLDVKNSLFDLSNWNFTSVGLQTVGKEYLYLIENTLGF